MNGNIRFHSSFHLRTVAATWFSAVWMKYQESELKINSSPSSLLATGVFLVQFLFYFTIWFDSISQLVKLTRRAFSWRAFSVLSLSLGKLTRPSQSVSVMRLHSQSTQWICLSRFASGELARLNSVSYSILAIYARRSKNWNLRWRLNWILVESKMSLAEVVRLSLSFYLSSGPRATGISAVDFWECYDQECTPKARRSGCFE